MSNNKQAIEQLCSYFDREIGEILRLVVKHSDGNSEPSATSGPLYRKLLYVTMLDTLAGLRFDKKMFSELSRRNYARFSRFVIDHCSWSEAELVSLPFLFEKLKEQKLEVRSLGQFVSDKLLRFSTKVSDGVTVVASEMDEHESVLLGHATTKKEERLFRSINTLRFCIDIGTGSFMNRGSPVTRWRFLPVQYRITTAI